MKKAPPLNPVSERDVAAFDRFVTRWQAILNLRNWRIERTNKRDAKHMASLVSVEHEHALARYSVGVNFGATKVTPRELESAALHELLHILLRPMIDEAVAQGEYNDAVLGYEHQVIVLLESLLQDAYGTAKATT